MRLRATLLLVALAACARRAEPEAARESDAGRPAPAFATRADRMTEAGMLAEASRYLDDPSFRRAALEASLVNPGNSYSRHRLEHYALEKRGWDLLPAWNPVSVPVDAALAADLRAHHEPKVPPSTRPLWNGTRPTTMPEWVALGREVFFGYPLRAEIYAQWALERPKVAEGVGLRAGADGSYPGLRAFVDVDGGTKIGITCAVCHASVDRTGKLVVGEARRAFDYGALRLAYHADTKTAVDPELARRMKTWGPGRADVTEDDAEDPVAIPDLWGLRDQTFLTQAGTIRHDGATALAIRQETQLLDSNHQKVRPPRELAYALAMFLYALEPPSHDTTTPSARGQTLFRERCAGCHENASYGGDPRPVDKVGTHPALATGAARGTGTYRPPALVRVDRAAPYFHDGSVASLDDVLAPERLAPGYARGTLGRGAVRGHTFGTDLPPPDRAALVAFLRTL